MNTFNSKNAVVFLDFDNTITTYDVFDNMLLQFSEDDTWKNLEERWKNNEIGSRECLEGQIRTVSVTKKALDEYLGRVKLDPYFKRLLHFLRAKRIRTVVLSDNFDYLLSRILSKNGIRGLEIYSNKARLVGGRLVPSFPFTDKKCRVCAHCKKKNLLSNINGHSVTIYVGDGQSDTCPAKYVNKVFAKETLLDYCRKEEIPHIPYKNLKKVYEYLKRECENGKDHFAFMGGYHGRTLAASAITSSFRYRERYGHFGDRAWFIPYPYCFRCPYEKKREFCDLYCVRQFERLFETEYYSVINKKTNKSEFAAFYVEPVQGTGGYVVPPADYFSALKDIMDKYGILLVDDEIQMGFFRTGKFWAIEHFGITPDIIVFGKSLTNGLNPLSGIWAREELIAPDVFPPGSTHSTFSSNPLGTAAGLEVMKLIEESDFASEIPKKGRSLISRLKRLQRKYPQIGDVDGLGLAIRIEMCRKDGYTPDKELADAIVDIGLSGKLTAGGKRRGLVLDVGGYYKNVFTLAPSFYITEKEMDLGVDLFEEALLKAIKNS